jgi:hypothetical protein
MIRPIALVASLCLAACGGSSAATNDGEVLDQAKAGEVSLAMFSNGTTGYQYTIWPKFIAAPPADVCIIIQDLGPCRKIECPEARKSLSASSAGTIHIAAGTQTLDLVPDFMGYTNTQTPAQTPTSFFNGGEQLSFSAPGGTAPAFNATVTAPSQLFVTAPVDATVMLSPVKDLPVTWTGTSAGLVIFEASIKADNNFIRLQCHYPGTATSGIVPASALATLTPGSGYTVDVFTRSRTVVVNGDWSIAVEGVFHAGLKGVSAYARPATVPQ